MISDGAGHHFFIVGADSQYHTIQAAMNAASSGDTILLEPGTYNETVVANGKMVSIEGFGGDNGVGGAVLNGSITETGALANALTIEGLIIHATGQQDGISLTPTLTGAETITVNNVAIDGASQTGYFVNGGGTDLTWSTHEFEPSPTTGSPRATRAARATSPTSSSSATPTSNTTSR